MNKILSKCTKTLSACLVLCSTVFGSFQPVIVSANSSSLGFNGTAIINEAEKHIGKGYVWGATGPNVFDCSGFTQYVFGQVGYGIPRTAEQQRQYMMSNSVELPRGDVSSWNKGDLIFYGSGEAEHVAIYAGDGYVIDCLGSSVSSLPGVTKHKYDAVTDKNGHQYAIMGTYAVAQATGELQILKLSNNEGWVLEGAVFKITNNATGLSLTRTTNADGIINVTGLNPGTYTITEISAPAGYLLDSTPQVVTINGGETINNNRLTFKNSKPTGKIVLTKYNFDKSETIPNTTYTVRYPNGNTSSVTTDSNGKITLDNLTILGTYTFTETKAADGYIIDTYPIYVKLEYVDQNTKVITKEVEHINYEPSGTLYITKNDSDTNTIPQGEATLAGAVYNLIAEETIYNTAHSKIMYEKGDVVAQRTTNADGSMDPIRGLYMGKYKVVEIEAPTGYLLNNKEYFVEFSKEDETKEIIKYLDVYDDVIKGDIEINKVTDITGAEVALPYIPFTLTDSKGNTLTEISDDNGDLAFRNLPYGTYTLSEQSVENNEGLALMKNMTIVIDGSKSVYEYSIVNHATQMSFYKVDADTKEDLAGATLIVTNFDSGEIMDKWVSDGKAHVIRGLIEGETYVLTELIAPEGYDLAEPIEFVAQNNSSITMEDARIVTTTDVFFSKKDITSQDELPGAQLMIKEYDTNKIVKTWISTNTPTRVELEKGKKYIFEETIAPTGYVQAEMIVFTAGDEQTITMYDDYTKVSVLKTTETNVPLAGAKLQLAKADGTIVKTWVSTNTPMLFTKLELGYYTLTELEAPNGYDIAEPITFEVINDGELINITMKDKETPIVPTKEVDMFMSKQDITTKKELVGAQMELKELNTGEIVDSWTSREEAHKVKVTEGVKYVLTEITAPDGYLKAESITFTAKENETITMYDDYTKVSISKQDITSKEELAGAKLTLKDSEGNVVDSWISGEQPHLITKIKIGTYTLIEETAPEGYLVAEEITFEVKATGEIQTVIMYDELKPTETKPVKTGVGTSKNSTLPFVLVIGLALGGLAIVKSKKSYTK